MALTVGAVTLGAFVYEHETWFGGRLEMPAWARVIGWMLIAVSTVFGSVAHRQIGVRVRSFAPFFERRGHIDLETTGAYGVVRHPIYAAGRVFQFGVFLVTGYPSVLLAWAVFGFGAIWFTRQEERRLIALLDDTTAYERYRRRVPALFPFLRPRTPSA
jgi:protein-S-isoprenylcysteine O-methyltransferase Ste14